MPKTPQFLLMKTPDTNPSLSKGCRLILVCFLALSQSCSLIPTKSSENKTPKPPDSIENPDNLISLGDVIVQPLTIGDYDDVDEPLIMESEIENLPDHSEPNLSFSEQKPNYVGKPLNPDDFELPQYVLKIGSNQESNPIQLSYHAPDKIVYGKAKAKAVALLPLSGEFSSVGKQIQNGLIQAHLYAPDMFSALHFYDTASMPINALYQYISKRKYDIIIGPIQEKNVRSIRYDSTMINIPLNHVETQSKGVHPLNFQVISEIDQLLEEGLRKKYDRALLLVTNSAKGEIFSEKLSSRWFEMEKIITEVLFLGENQNENTHRIKQHLYGNKKLSEIEYDDSQQTYILSENDEDYPFIRQDIDVIYIALKANNAGLIYPVMKLIGGFHIPVLSTSMVPRSESFSYENKKDLSNITFLDSAWRYDENSRGIFQSIGVDAYRLANAIWRYPRFVYEGWTGDYYFSHLYGMQRKLKWFDIKGQQFMETSQ